MNFRKLLCTHHRIFEETARITKLFRIGQFTAAGWLIDQCHLKGFQIGGAAVHQQQALVLINKGNATGQDVVKLAHHIRQTVADKFGVYLQPEVRFMGANGEVNSEQAIS